jgi:hypothetical protein
VATGALPLNVKLLGGAAADDPAHTSGVSFPFGGRGARTNQLVDAARRFLASGVSSDRNMPTMFNSLVASTGLTR